MPQLRTLALIGLMLLAGCGLGGCAIATGAIPAPDVIVTTHDNNCSGVARAARDLTVDQILASVEWCEQRDRASAVRIKPQSMMQRLLGAVLP